MKKYIAASLIGLSIFGLYSQSADAYYYDGMHSPNDYKALQKASNISNSTVTMKRYNYANKTKYKAVGRVSNKNGAKGLGLDSMGTGTVIGPHTFITNGHVIDDQYGRQANPKYITFDMNRDGNRIPYRFHATKIIKVPQSDIAIVYTKEKMSNYVKPLKLASNQQIANLSYNKQMYSLGYPWQTSNGVYQNTKAYWNKLRILQRSSNGSEIQFKDKFRAGASGSPIVDGNYTLYGLRTYGYNLRGSAQGSYARNEVAGGESFYGYAGSYVKQRIK